MHIKQIRLEPCLCSRAYDWSHQKDLVVTLFPCPPTPLQLSPEGQAITEDRAHPSQPWLRWSPPTRVPGQDFHSYLASSLSHLQQPVSDQISVSGMFTPNPHSSPLPQHCLNPHLCLPPLCLSQDLPPLFPLLLHYYRTTRIILLKNKAGFVTYLFKSLFWLVHG